ncbi:hypothetical protein TNCV_2778761 [Trichonephila clavipes]|nr:hypothetical protein TNCV_2778761 [Trichonephila clavipes]
MQGLRECTLRFWLELEFYLCHKISYKRAIDDEPHKLESWSNPLWLDQEESIGLPTRPNGPQHGHQKMPP